MEYKLSEQELKDLMHRTWLKSKKFYSGKENEYFYDYFESEKKQLPIHNVIQQRELLIAFDNMREFDIKHDDIEESVDYFLKNKESYL